MPGFGKAIFHGRLTADVEVKTTPNGREYANFSLAFDRYMGADAESKAEFPNFTAWGKTAGIIAKHFSKGSEIIVEGEYTSRQYTTEGESKPRTAVGFTVTSFDFCGGKRDAGDGSAAPAPARQSAPAPAAAAPSANDFQEIDGDDDDLPF